MFHWGYGILTHGHSDGCEIRSHPRPWLKPCLPWYFPGTPRFRGFLGGFPPSTLLGEALHPYRSRGGGGNRPGWNHQRMLDAQRYPEPKADHPLGAKSRFDFFCCAKVGKNQKRSKTLERIGQSSPETCFIQLLKKGRGSIEAMNSGSEAFGGRPGPPIAALWFLGGGFLGRQRLEKKTCATRRPRWSPFACERTRRTVLQDHLTP